MYYIYHIPGVKYGATHRWPQRAIEQGYEHIAYVVQTCNTPEETDEVERRLNIEAGYEWNESRSYLNMLAFSAKSPRTSSRIPKGGPSWSPGNHKEGATLGGIVMSSKVNTCVHCGHTGKGPNFYRYHSNNCKHKKG